ncbi:uncharacterized protein LOC143373174 isoform X2 [Andrena cerasifolii]|uniref:uncharacterized protein LOC143373174 isoform X2 n=1 Tax=Andrena cerasifolii TaxID=2819439 RepID=UPI0040384444
MSRPKERVPRRWRLKASHRKDSSSSEEPSSPTGSNKASPYAKTTSTPLRSRWELEKINRSPLNHRGEGGSEESEDESSSDEGVARFQEQKELPQTSRGRHQDDYERISRRQEGRHGRRGKRRPDRRSEESENGKSKVVSGPEDSGKRYGGGDAERSKRKSRSFRGEDELPITEILKRSQESTLTKYEHQPPLPELTTDKVYVQHRGGFSAMRIHRLGGPRGESKAEPEGTGDIIENASSPPIRLAIAVQKLWKSTGLVFQGLLGGMALMHFIMLYVFFNASMEFVADHSVICEIYTCIFSFLIAICIVSTFDKFDLARFDTEHLREIYFDYNKAVIAIPLYLVAFCLHEACSNTDNRLALVHYCNLNDSLWENATEVQTLLNDLNSWQKMTLSKDILAVFAWLFVSMGTKDDAFLIHLQSMEKYTHDVNSARQ